MRIAPVDANVRQDVTITIPARAFEHWSADGRRWVVEPGTFGLSTGPSSADLPLSADLEMSPGPVPPMPESL